LFTRFHGLLAVMVLVTAADAEVTAASRLVLEPGYFDQMKLKILMEGPFTL
jgi:hypothetical protein